VDARNLRILHRERPIFWKGLLASENVMLMFDSAVQNLYAA